MSMERFRFVPFLPQLGWPFFGRRRVAKLVCSHLGASTIRELQVAGFCLTGCSRTKLWSLGQKLVVEHDIEQ